MASRFDRLGNIDSYYKINKKIRKQYWKQFRKEFLYTNFGYMLLILLMVSIVVTASYLTPLLTAKLLDVAITKIGDFEKTMIIVGATMSSLLVARVLNTFLFQLLKNYEFKVYAKIQKDTWKKIMRIQVAQFDINNSGHYISRVMNDSKFISEFASNGLRAFAETILSVVVAVSFIFYISWVAGLYAIVISLISVYLSIKRKTVLNRQANNIRKAEDNFGARISNDISGIREIKNYVAFDKTYLSTKNFIVSINKENKLQSKIVASWMSWNTFLFGSFSIIFALIGIFEFNSGNIEIGDFTALLMYAGLMVRPVSLSAYVFESMFRAGVSLDRYYNFMQLEEEDHWSKSIGSLDGSIELKNVSLNFGSIHALKNINLKIKKGDHIGIVGGTGAGKSTLVRVLMGYYAPTKGEILFGNKKAINYSIDSIRNNISYMPQNPFISFTTIENNIKFGLKNVNNDTYKLAIKMSDVDTIINELEKKDQELVGPNGITLSGGQRQRLAISRMFLRNNPIIIFDEATSSLDNKTERFIQDNINSFAKDKTTITIAHRLTTLKNVDKIIVMEEGSIVEIGTEKELLDKKGDFWRFKNTLQIKEGNNE